MGLRTPTVRVATVVNLVAPVGSTQHSNGHSSRVSHFLKEIEYGYPQKSI